MSESSARRIGAAVPAFLALSCVGAFASAPAFADPGDPGDAADPAPTPDTDQARPGDVTVEGVRLRQEKDPKQVAPLVNTPRSIVVLPKEVIEQTGSTTLQDALRTVPGITFGAAEGGNPIGDRPFIRGFDSQGSIYVDGVRDLASQTREVFATDSIEIVRGSDSTLGGRGSPGGTINIISKLPQLDDFATASASYGTADFKRVSADVNLRVAPHVAVRLEGLWHDQDVAGRDAIYQRRWGFAPSVTIGLDTDTRLTVAGYYLRSHELPDSGIPYLYTIGNAPGTGMIYSEPAIGQVTTITGATGNVARSTFYGLADRDFRTQTTRQATMRVEHDFGALTLRDTARFNHDDQAYIYTQPDDSQGDVYGTTLANTGSNVTTGGEVWRRANTRYGYTKSIIDQLDLYGKFRTGAIEHSIAVGAEVSWEQTRRGAYVLASGSTVSPRCNTATIARDYCTSLFSANPYEPWVNYTSDTSTVATPIVPGATNTETQNDATTQAVYGFDSITLRPWAILNLGARYDRFTSTLTPPVAAGATTVQLSRTDELFNWQAGLVLKPTRSTTLYGDYATSATPPNSLLGEGSETNALPTTSTTATLATLDQLKPTKTKSYEIGAKAALFDSRLNLQLAAFQTQIDNARVQVDANTVSFIGRSRIRGIEFSASGTILPGWTVFGGYTYLDPVVIDGGTSTLTAAAVGTRAAQVVYVPSVTTGKQLPQTARNSFTGTTSVNVTRKLRLGGTAIFMDRQFGGYSDNRAATQDAAGNVTVTPATKVLYRTIPDYWRFDLNASYALTPHVSLSVNAQNVTDKVYFTQAYASHYASIAAGRTVFGTVQVKF